MGSKSNGCKRLFPATGEPEGERRGLLKVCPICGRPLEEDEREKVSENWLAIEAAYKAGLKEGERRARMGRWGLV
jgi:hypothetical protein